MSNKEPVAGAPYELRDALLGGLARAAEKCVGPARAALLALRDGSYSYADEVQAAVAIALLAGPEDGVHTVEVPCPSRWRRVVFRFDVQTNFLSGGSAPRDAEDEIYRDCTPGMARVLSQSTRHDFLRARAVVARFLPFKRMLVLPPITGI